MYGRDLTRRPSYDRGKRAMLFERGSKARDFAAQLLQTVHPFLTKPVEDLCVLDVGCGYGHTALEVARKCKRVVGIDANAFLITQAKSLASSHQLRNLEFREESIYDLTERSCYDLAVLDNVLEHLVDQHLALNRVSASLRPSGVVYILVPNRLWPVEVHYGLPLLSYLPLPLANVYLRLMRRGTDFGDASRAPSYWSLNRLLRKCRELNCRYVLPADISLATLGRSAHYRLGVTLLRRMPCLWAISKAFLVVAVKHEATYE